MTGVTSSGILKAIALIVAVVGVSFAQPPTPSGDLLEMLPDGGAVAVIDLQRITGSPLWAALNSAELRKGAIENAQSEIANLGVRLSEVHTVALVFPATNRSKPIVAITGGFEQGLLLEHLRSGGKVKLTSEKYKGFDIWDAKPIQPTSSSRDSSEPRTPPKTDPDPLMKDHTSFTFYDSNTVVVGSPEGVRDSVDVQSGTKPGIAQNTRLIDALTQNPAAAIRFAFTISPGMTSGLQTSDLPLPEFSSISMIFGTLDIGSGIELNATLRSDNAEHAKVIAERLNALLTMARGLLGSARDSKRASVSEALNTIKILSANADVNITGTLPTDLLNSLLRSSVNN